MYLPLKALKNTKHTLSFSVFLVFLSGLSGEKINLRVSPVDVSGLLFEATNWYRVGGLFGLDTFARIRFARFEAG